MAGPFIASVCDHFPEFKNRRLIKVNEFILTIALVSFINSMMASFPFILSFSNACLLSLKDGGN